MGKLIEFLATHYASTSEKLTALLKHKEITFELLPVFFRPNSIVYMVSADSEHRAHLPAHLLAAAFTTCSPSTHHHPHPRRVSLWVRVAPLPSSFPLRAPLPGGSSVCALHSHRRRGQGSHF